MKGKLAKLSEANRARYIVFSNAVVKCTTAYNAEPTASKLRDLRAAEKGLADITKELFGDDQPVTAESLPSDSQPAVFANRARAWQYLRDNGYQISQKMFYLHCNQGKLDRRTDKKYNRADVNRYATAFCKLTPEGKKLQPVSTTAEQKAEVDLKRAKVRLQKEQRELELLEGRSIPRAEVELMIVGRAVAFLSHLRAMVQMHTSDWLHIGEGNQSRAVEVIAAIQESIEEHVSTFARDVEFKVMLAPDNAAPEQPDDMDDGDE